MVARQGLDGSSLMQFAQLQRREFITLLGGAAAWLAACGATRKQQPTTVVAVLSALPQEFSSHLVAALAEGLE